MRSHKAPSSATLESLSTSNPTLSHRSLSPLPPFQLCAVEKLCSFIFFFLRKTLLLNSCSVSEIFSLQGT
jgi:hypothetical protein